MKRFIGLIVFFINFTVMTLLSSELSVYDKLYSFVFDRSCTVHIPSDAGELLRQSVEKEIMHEKHSNILESKDPELSGFLTDYETLSDENDFSLPMKKSAHYKRKSTKQSGKRTARKLSFEDCYIPCKPIHVTGTSFFSDLELHIMNELRQNITKNLSPDKQATAYDNLTRAMVYCYMAQTVKDYSIPGTSYSLRNHKEGSLKYLNIEYVLGYDNEIISYFPNYGMVFSGMVQFCYSLIHHVPFPLNACNVQYCESKFEYTCNEESEPEELYE